MELGPPVTIWGESITQWIVAVSGVLALLISIWAVWLLKRTLQATREATQAAFQGTQAAETAVSVASDTAKRQLRAYLNHVGGRVIEFEGNRPLACIEVRNTGQTPAYNVVARNGSIFTHEPTEDTVLFELKNAPKRIGTVGPQSHYDGVFPLHQPPLSQEQKTMLREGSATLYVFGRVEYRDAFDQPRFMEFRMRFGGGVETGESFRFAVCEGGNEAD